MFLSTNKTLTSTGDQNYSFTHKKCFKYTVKQNKWTNDL